MLSHFSCVRLFATPWTIACQAPLSMGILQARILEWVAMPWCAAVHGVTKSRTWLKDWIDWEVPCQVTCRVWLFATLWTAARQAPLSMGFSRQEYWSGLPCPPPGNLPNPGIKPVTLMSPALIGGFVFFLSFFFFTTCTVWEARISLSNFIFMWSVSIYICFQFFCVYLLFTNPGYLRWLAWTDKGEAPFWLTPRLLVTPMASVSQEEVNEIAKEKICSDYI